MGRHVYARIAVIVRYHYINPTKRIGLIQSRPYHHLIELTWSRHGIAEKLLRL